MVPLRWTNWAGITEFYLIPLISYDNEHANTLSTISSITVWHIFRLEMVLKVRHVPITLGIKENHMNFSHCRVHVPLKLFIVHVHVVNVVVRVEVAFGPNTARWICKDDFIPSSTGGNFSAFG